MDSVSAPGYVITLEKTASESELTMAVGEDRAISFTIQVGAVQSGTYSISGNIFVENTGEWPANVTAVSDTVWYKAGGPAWLPAATSVTTTVPLGNAAISTGAHVYSYSGTFTLPVALAGVTAMSNLIEITIDNHPNDGVHTFHYRLSFDKPSAGESLAWLSDVETITPEPGLTYTIDSVTINGSAVSLSGPWELDLAEAPFEVIIDKTLHASAAGDYVLNNKAVIGDLEDKVDVLIHVPEEPRLKGAIEGFKLDEAQAAVAGVTIHLMQGEEIIATAVTDEAGHYSFTDLELGTYMVHEVVPAGWKALSVESVEVELIDEEAVRVDFQNARLKGAIEGFKLDEAQAAVAGVTIHLMQGEEIIATAVTDEAGHYSFTDLELGTYMVHEVVPAGWKALSAESVEVELIDEEAVRVDFQNARLASISGTKWNDLNGNGLHETDEPGLGGVLISLSGEGIFSQAVTAADGAYTFANLPAGSYTLSETVPDGWANTVPISRTVIVEYGDQLTGIDFLNAVVEVAGEVITPPPAGTQTPAAAESLPYTGFDQNIWLVAAGMLLLMGLLAIMLGKSLDRDS